MSAAAALLLAAAISVPDATIVRQGSTLQAAFTAAYGEARHHRMTTGDDDYTLTPSALIRTKAGFVLVADAYNEAGCHACMSGLAMTTFADVDGKPGKITGRLPFEPGGYGSETRATWTIERRLTRYPALLIEGGWGGQGCTSHGPTLVELTPERPIERLAYLAFAKDDTEADCWRIHAVGTVVPGRQGVSFAMRYRGWTWPAGHRHVPLNRTVTYRLKNGKFVPDSPVDDLTC